MNRNNFSPRCPRRTQEDGVAIILVLAFLVLLTGLIFAFFSRSITERQVANSSLSESKADILARSAVDVIIGDLKQEIVAGSSSPSTGVALYLPKSAANVVPQASGTPAPSPAGTNAIPNLVRRSVRSDPLAQGTAKAVTTSASAINSTTNVSANGRSVSPARWNSHYLIPRKDTSTTIDSTPVSEFTAPDWVMVTSGGPKVLDAPDKTTIGRYAYAIYDEGGLLDANVAGFPSLTDPSLSASKSSVAFADLSALPYPIPRTPADGKSQVDQIVGWRNYATTQPNGAFRSYDLDANAAKRFADFTLNTRGGFLTVNPQPFPSPATAASRTDQIFTSRQALLGFRRSINFSQNALQYLGTFSRELNQPSVVNDPGRPQVVGGYGNIAASAPKDDIRGINPTFLKVRRTAPVTATPNADGVLAVKGDPVVKKRFPLNRLAWLTFKGPIATGSGTTGTLSGDPDVQPLIAAYRAQGLSDEFLRRGTADNILSAFGLTWNAGKNRWDYRPGSTGIATLNTVAGQPREADFFELLSASVAAGASTRAAIAEPPSATNFMSGTVDALHPLNWQFRRDESVDLACIQLGANIIDQFDADDYPTRINFDDGTVARIVSGVENLPYVYSTRTGMIKLREASPPAPDNLFNYTPPAGAETSANASIIKNAAPESPNGPLTDTGVAALMLLPEIWNPHDASTTVGVARPTQFRVVVDSTDPDSIGKPGYNQFNVFAWKATTQLWSDQTYPSTIGAANVGGGATANPDNGYIPFLRNSGGQITGGFFGMKRVLNETNSALTFTIPAGNQTMFREPALLFKPDRPTGSQLAMSGTTLSDPDMVSFVGGSGLHAVGTPDPALEPRPPAGGNYVGIPIGLVPLRWIGPRVSPLPVPPATYTKNYIHTGLRATPIGGGTRQPPPPATNTSNYPITLDPYLTVSLQYQSPAGNWVTYDQKYTSVEDQQLIIPQGSRPSGPIIKHTVWTGFMDPRTSRFGPFLPGYDVTGTSSTPPVYWLDAENGYLDSDRPAANSGYGLTAAKWNGLRGPGWTTPTAVLHKGLMSQNTTANSEFYADADTVRRGAAGTYATTGTTGFPMATATDLPAGTRNAQSDSRPVILNRPFRSVGELGHVFSGTPWKNVDLFTAESGHAALLDVFSTNETDGEMIAGKVNLNGRQAPVFQAIIANAYKDELNAGTNGTASTVAGKIAAALVARTDRAATAPKGPLANVSELIGKWTSGTSFDGFSNDLTSTTTPILTGSDASIQRFRESAVRALAASGQTRTWNLMIDVVAQAGRYPQTAATLDKFNVEGEQRYWVHLAIDRYSGQIIDQQIEVVKE